MTDNEPTPTPKDWRRMLTEIGGYNNEMVGVPAGAVREMIDEIERLRRATACSRDGIDDAGEGALSSNRDNLSDTTVPPSTAPARSPADELHAETERVEQELETGFRLHNTGGNHCPACLNLVKETQSHMLALDAALAAREGAHQPHEEKELSGHQGSGVPAAETTAECISIPYEMTCKWDGGYTTVHRGVMKLPPLPAAEKASWKLVPVKPTPEMLWEGFPLRSDEDARADYCAMLAAAPVAPVIEGESK